MAEVTVDDSAQFKPFEVRIKIQSLEDVHTLGLIAWSAAYESRRFTHHAHVNALGQKLYTALRDKAMQLGIQPPLSPPP